MEEDSLNEMQQQQPDDQGELGDQMVGEGDAMDEADYSDNDQEDNDGQG